MTKIIYNACYGGFSLSHEAVLRYAEIKGIKLYPEKNKEFDYGRIVFYTYWTVPTEERVGYLEGEAWANATIEERVAANKKYDECVISDREIDRADPALAQVVEELGDKANGMCAKLSIYEVPAGERYRIDEYDGYESVMQPGDYEWKKA
jgi:hypothetical protein